MLTLERRTGETLLISPSEDLPHDMTVAELFAHGPVEITLKESHKGKAKLGINAPLALTILR